MTANLFKQPLIFFSFNLSGRENDKYQKGHSPNPRVARTWPTKIKSQELHPGVLREWQELNVFEPSPAASLGTHQQETGIGYGTRAGVNALDTGCGCPMSTLIIFYAFRNSPLWESPLPSWRFC